MPVTNNVFSQFSKPQTYLTQTLPAQKQQAANPAQKIGENITLTKTEKKQLTAAGIITLSGILLFAGRKFIAGKFFKKPDIPKYRPLENLVDDTMSQAGEIINNKYENIIINSFYNANPEEIIKAHRLASGNALKNLSVILAFKHKYLHEIDDSTYIKLIERYIPEMFNKEHKLEYNEPIIIEELSQAYYNTQNKAKAFEILSRAKNNFTKDGNWAESSFINQEIILNGREKNYGKVLEIYNNSDYEVNEDNVLLTIMQSLKEIEGFDSSINFFENNFHRITLDCKKSFDYYLDLSIENGRKTHFYKTMAENKHITARKFFNILSENKEKLELNEKTNQLVELYNELYKTEREYDFDEAAPELVDKSIEIYTKAKNYNILSEQEADDILAKLNKYKSSPSPESYDENIQPIEILMLEKKHPFFKKVVDFLNED